MQKFEIPVTMEEQVVSDELIDNEEKYPEGVIVEEEDTTISEEPIKSRFADLQLDVKSLMRKGVNVTTALKNFKNVQKSPESGQESLANMPKAQKRIITKRRRSQTPSDLIQHPHMDTSKAESDMLDTEEVSEAEQKSHVTSINLGVKMTMAQHTRVESIPSRQSQFRGKSASAIQRQRTGFMKRPTKQAAIHTSKQRNRSSKSAVFSRQKFGHVKDDELNASNVDFSIPLLAKKNPSNTDQFPKTESLENQRSVTPSGEPQTGGPVTHVQMVYKRPEIFSGQAEEKVDSIHELSKDSMKTINNLGTKLSSDETVASSKNTTLTQDKQGMGDSFLNKEEKEKEVNEHEKQTKEDEKAKKTDDNQAEQLESKQKLKQSFCEDDDSGDEDDLHMPNLLEYDFHAIYKKDGLQFDEQWQDRMLERYMLLKMQKKQRQEAAVNRRIILEQERHFRLLAAQPELLHKYTEPWFKDPDALANYILNSALLRGEPNSLLTTSPTYVNSIDRPHSQLGRPTSSMSSCHSHSKSSDRLTDHDTNFRFSIRSKTPETPSVSGRNSQHKTWSRPSTPLRTNHGSGASKNSKSSHHHLPERPRSSTSIPGRTRYILVKPDIKPLTRKKPIHPTKLEEQLLRRRFPSQHHTMMKSLGRLDEFQEPIHYWHPESSAEHKHCNTSRQEKESGLSRNNSSSRLCDAEFKGILQGFKSGDGVTERNPFLSFHSKTETYRKKTAANRSLSRNLAINPLEIVKRQSLIHRNTPRKSRAGSVFVK